MKVAIFASGSGSNFEAIVQGVQRGDLALEIVLLFCDQPDAYVIERAKKLNIPVKAFSPKEFSDRGTYEAEIIRILASCEVEFIVLAGYMRLIGAGLLGAYPQKIINIHPSLLPAFPGLHGIRDAFEAGVSKTGVTIHYIDEGIDTGPIIAQEEVTILPEDDLATLEKRIHQVEHRLYVEVLKKL
ncbi:phosphoribosylglycinamide formyltransferase [Vagococcus sp. BWB3-3]|uniref:Phosphoribosylglycinamide formyltransferase n=1 Tax=Vagococcus allomyrinae TaxID=2794353 RepID=A0A940PGJ0_9ENTE|nr:phosphoribosylglycinamide formyltransferase [Vagococcus allomyrinae]MBP1043533.1 phosphoribosylglycinamide formyltransferase [Vagococcus allomyrinae]